MSQVSVALVSEGRVVHVGWVSTVYVLEKGLLRRQSVSTDGGLFLESGMFLLWLSSVQRCQTSNCVTAYLGQEGNKCVWKLGAVFERQPCNVQPDSSCLLYGLAYAETLAGVFAVAGFSAAQQSVWCLWWGGGQEGRGGTASGRYYIKEAEGELGSWTLMHKIGREVRGLGPILRSAMTF